MLQKRQKVLGFCEVAWANASRAVAVISDLIEAGLNEAAWGWGYGESAVGVAGTVARGRRVGGGKRWMIAARPVRLRAMRRDAEAR
jgi:hypothetical protein